MTERYGLSMDWKAFGEAVSLHADLKGWNMAQVGRAVGISKPRAYDAAAGKGLGVPHFLALCRWMQCDPFDFCQEKAPK